MEDIVASASTSTVTLDEHEPRFIVPFRCGIFGPSESGKSTLIRDLLKYRDIVFNQEFQRIIYCLPCQTQHSRMEYVDSLREVCINVEIREGLPDLNSHCFKNKTEHKLLILDDLSKSVVNSADYLSLMTQGSHHFNISLIYTSQNYFEKSVHGKTFHRQLSMKIVFEDKSDMSVLQNMSRTIFGKVGYLSSAMELLKKSYPKDKSYYLVIGNYSYLLFRVSSWFF